MTHRQITSNDLQCDIIPKIKIPLKPHQKTMIYAMQKLETSSGIDISQDEDVTNKLEISMGILGDSVGSGKSLTMLGLIASGKNNLDKKITKTTYINNNNFTIQVSQKINIINTNLLIVSHTISKQWDTYIKDLTDLKYLSIFKNKDIDNLKGKNVIEEFNKYDLIIVSSPRVRKFHDILRNMDNMFWRKNYFLRLIIDEADSILFNPSISCVTINSVFQWFISSSINALQFPSGKTLYANQHGDTRSYYDYLNGYMYRRHINGVQNKSFIVNIFGHIFQSSYKSKINNIIYLKNDDNFIRDSFMLEDPVLNTIMCKDNTNYKILKNIVNNDIINLINAGEIDGAINKFNCQKTTKTNLVATITAELENELNNKKIEYEMRWKMSFNNKQHVIEKISLEIYKLINKINLIKDRLKENNMCPICYDTPENDSIAKCCNTTFCLECITLWLNENHSCPHCRTQLDNSNLIIITSEHLAKKQETVKLDDKLSNIDRLLKDIFQKKRDSKVLIFSEYENIYTDISSILYKQGVRNSTIYGNTAYINKTIEKFKSDNESKIDVLFLNSRFCGSGLNMENATDVIIYHSMSEELEKQVIGRAQRPGRKSRLNIWKLCYENELNTN